MAFQTWDMLVSLFCECLNVLLSWWLEVVVTLYMQVAGHFCCFTIEYLWEYKCWKLPAFILLKKLSFSCSCPPISSLQCKGNSDMLLRLCLNSIFRSHAEKKAPLSNFPYWVPWHRPTSMFSEFSSNYVCSYMPNMTKMLYILPWQSIYLTNENSQAYMFFICSN